jgi:adenylate cyclase
MATHRLPRLTRRDLRLGSGLVLLTYMVLHMLNHALGLISLEAAERGLVLAVALWHSWPGSILLYGSAGAHLMLAFLEIYEKRTLRMRPIEIVRICAGLTIPTLLIGHLASTRIAFEFFDAAPHYSRIVSAIWASNGEARQLALLAPGWIHGCLGIYLAFGTRPWFKRLWLLPHAAAVMLPLLSGAGFMAMAREVSVQAIAPPDPEFLAALARVRSNLLALYFGALAAVLLARWLRQLGAHRARP